jgi:hypothetical protein
VDLINVTYYDGNSLMVDAKHDIIDGMKTGSEPKLASTRHIEEFKSILGACISVLVKPPTNRPVVLTIFLE